MKNPYKLIGIGNTLFVGPIQPKNDTKGFLAYRYMDGHAKRASNAT